MACRQRTWETYFGTNKEVFDAELYILGKRLSIALNSGQTGRRKSSQRTTTKFTKIHILQV